MQGRKPTPSHLKALAGNPGHRPMNTAEPVPLGELFAPPDWLNERQKEIWRAAIDNAPKGLLRRLDGRLLIVWVIACDTHSEAAKKVEEFGMVVKSPNAGVPVQSPFLPIINRQAEIMMRAASELGFTPTSRSRITLGGEASKETNKFANNAARRDNSAA